MFFDVDSRGTKIFPTVFALWKVPELLPAFILKECDVSRFIIGGADLMFPGISLSQENLPEFLAGEQWAVRVPGNSATIAVGYTTMSSNEALQAGLHGKALKIYHRYRDALWESEVGRCVPNAGFSEDVVFKDPSLSCQDSDSFEVDAFIDQEKGSNNKEVGEAIKNLDLSEQVSTDICNIKVIENVSTDAACAEGQHTLSISDVDALLDKCLLLALFTTIKDEDLPIAGSTLWLNHVLPCRPSGIMLDVRKSSHKKLSKWLQSKSSRGLLSVKEDKYTKEIMIRSVNRKHSDYTSFKPENQQVEKIEQHVDGATNGVVSTMLEIVEMYKPGPHVDPIFTSVGADPKQFYSAAEAMDIVFRYVEKENLVKPLDSSFVALDRYLCDALFKESTKNGSTCPTSIHMEDLGAAFINQMQAHHQVTRGTQSIVRKGFLKPIRITRERRLGHKKMMRLSGLESFLIDAKALSSELQKKFGCSTTLVEFPGKKGVEILVLCGMSGGLARFLVKRYQIPQRYIEVFDKTKK